MGEVMVVLVGGFIVLLGFLVCRELVMWYWKINEVVGLQRDILEALKQLNQRDP